MTWRRKGSWNRGRWWDRKRAGQARWMGWWKYQRGGDGVLVVREVGGSRPGRPLWPFKALKLLHRESREVCYT